MKRVPFRFATIAACLAALGLTFVAVAATAQVQANSVTNNSTYDVRRYDDGARWGFVTDKHSTKVAVVDTFLPTDDPVVDVLEFEVVPAELAVSEVQNIIVYSDLKTPILYVYSLTSHEQWTMQLDIVPEALVFHSDGATLAIGGQDHVIILQPLSQTYVQELENIQSPFTMNFDGGGYNLYITEHNSGKTHIWRTHNDTWGALQLGNGGAVGEITLSPDARLAMVAQQDENSVYIWDLYMDRKFDSIDLQAPAFRPYVSSDSRHIILTDHDGNGRVVDAWTGETVREMDLGGAPRVVRTGWLETIGVVETDKHLSVFEIQAQTPAQTLPISGALNEVVVVADSKTLFATQDGSSEVLVMDIRTGEARAPIETGLKQPNHFAMGLTNTLCN